MLLSVSLYVKVLLYIMLPEPNSKPVFQYYALTETYKHFSLIYLASYLHYKIDLFNSYFLDYTIYAFTKNIKTGSQL